MEKLQIDVYLPTDDFSDTVKKSIDVIVLGYDAKVGDVVYELRVPKYLYEKLKDSSDKYYSYEKYQEYLKDQKKQYGTTSNAGRNGITMIQKTFKGKLISQLVDSLGSMVSDAVMSERKKTLSRTKKIFVRFHSSVKHDKCDWTGGYKGEVITSLYQVFIGYEVLEPISLWDRAIQPNYYTLIKYATGSLAKWDTGFKEANELQPLYMDNNKARDGFIGTHMIFDWTQEREDFFKSIQDKFKELDRKLNEYFKNMNDEKLGILMAGEGAKMLGM